MSKRGTASDPRDPRWLVVMKPGAVRLIPSFPHHPACPSAAVTCPWRCVEQAGEGGWNNEIIGYFVSNGRGLGWMCANQFRICLMSCLTDWLGWLGGLTFKLQRCFTPSKPPNVTAWMTGNSLNYGQSGEPVRGYIFFDGTAKLD